MFVLVLRKNRAQLKKKWFDPSTKRNGHEFQKIYIRPHSAVDSSQWDWGISHKCNQQDNSTYNHCLYTVQTMLNFAAGHCFCCKIPLVWIGSSLSARPLVSIKQLRTVSKGRPYICNDPHGKVGSSSQDPGDHDPRPTGFSLSVSMDWLVTELFMTSLGSVDIVLMWPHIFLHMNTKIYFVDINYYLLPTGNVYYSPGFCYNAYTTKYCNLAKVGNSMWLTCHTSILNPCTAVTVVLYRWQHLPNYLALCIW